MLAAYVLHHYDWSESSLILDLLTREQGRLTVVAKGAKRPYSQLRPVLLPFQRVNVQLVKPKPKSRSTAATDQEAGSEVHTLRTAEWAGGAPMFGGPALFSGFYLNELLMKLLARGDPYPDLFDAYAQTLAVLGLARDDVVEAALRAFEIKLLQSMGLLPDLSVITLTQHDVDPERSYAMLPEAGVIAGRSNIPVVPGHVLLALEAALAEDSLATLQQACLAALPELKIALRGLLHYHLGSSVLRTRQVMLQMLKP